MNHEPIYISRIPLEDGRVLVAREQLSIRVEKAGTYHKGFIDSPVDAVVYAKDRYELGVNCCDEIANIWHVFESMRDDQFSDELREDWRKMREFFSIENG